MNIRDQGRCREWVNDGCGGKGGGVTGCNVSPLNPYVEVVTPIPENVFGDRALKEIIKVK